MRLAKKILWNPWFPFSGLLLFAGWPVSSLTLLLFIGFVPLLRQEAVVPNTANYFFVIFWNMLVWNTATTWWIWNASPAGAIGAVLFNSVLMCFPWMLYRFTRKRLGDIMGYLCLILTWVSLEYLHHNWDLSWPWLTLGNGFSGHPEWVKWYQFTGTTGGSLWLLGVNAGIWHAIKPKAASGNPQPAKLIVGLLLCVAPLGISALLHDASPAPAARWNVVVVQPNVEAYTEKFNTDPAILVRKMITLAETKVDSNTRLVVWPETAIPVQVWEDQISTNLYYQDVFAFCRRHPQIRLVTGIDSYKNWGMVNPGGFSIRQLESGEYYEAFNTAMATDSSGSISLYHKSKLVPGVESLPAWLGFLGSWFDEFGGINGSLGKSKTAVVFADKNNPYKTAPIICYESIYSDYITEYVRAGANLLTVLTNDGWWGNTAGYRQHMSYARLRAVETGLWVARSANTGISCFISPDGEVFQAQPWNKAAAIKMEIPAENVQTFYVTHGDWLSRLAWPLCLVVLAASAGSKWWRTKNMHRQ